MKLIAREETEKSSKDFFEENPFWDNASVDQFHYKRSSQQQKIRDAQIHMIRSLLDLECIKYQD